MGEQAALLALVQAADVHWHRVADLVEQVGSALRIVAGGWGYLDAGDAALADALHRGVSDDAVGRLAEACRDWVNGEVRLLTVLDEDYPLNLREVYNRPPFLFVCGRLEPRDSRAVAVVGSRQASACGRQQARELAGGLAEQGVTVVSGLALGIDAAAHEGALEAGGRTVAVLGAGIRQPVYPAENRQLAEQILTSGAHVSQFWPDAPPTRWTFPMRNVVTSGMTLGTVVVEAHGRSGASLQARRCVEHGKRLFLVRSLVLGEEWAQRYAEQPGVIVVDDVAQVLDTIDELVNPPAQLTLC